MALPYNHGEPWTGPRDECLRKMVSKGASVSKIASWGSD